MKVKRSYLESLFHNNIQRVGLPEPISEYKFHQWYFDFAYVEVMIFIEVQGGTYNGGHHVTAKGYRRDCIKSNKAQLEGWAVLWADREMINSYEFAMDVKKLILRRIHLWKKTEKPF